jgi:hypothetical protein
MALCGGALRAWAAPGATTTTMAVTSGGSAVTMVTSGSVVTLTATVTAAGTAVTVGQVNFCDATAKSCTDIHLLGMAQITKSGTAAIKFGPGIGSHSYKAVFLGTPNGTLNATASTSGTAALTVTGIYPTETTIAQSGSVGNYTLTATVSGAGSTVPTGTVSFLDASNGDAVLGTAALTAGTAGLSFLNVSETLGGPVAVGDFNGDGIPDIFLVQCTFGMTGACRQWATTVLLGNGDGTFTATSASPFPYGPHAIAVGDFNGDGILDLAVANAGSNDVTILRGNGDGTFTATATSPPTGTDPYSIAVGDFNGDGIPDLAVANAGSNDVTILLGNGDGTFTATATSPPTGTDPYSIAVGDFNGDGIPDLAVMNSSQNTVSVLLGNGDGTFMPAPPLVVGSYPGGIAVGDFNGDGIPDLAVANVGSNDVTIFLGNGNGTFTATATSPPTGTYPYSIAVGDFNGDGKTDLAVANYVSSTISVLLGNGDGTFSATATSPKIEICMSCSFAIAVGDFNGDGLSDLVVSEDSEYSYSEVFLASTQSANATANGIAVPVATVTQNVLSSYAGDSNYETSTSGTISLSAAQGTPIVSLNASPNPAIYGASVTLTATVTGTGLTPTGTVYFYAGSKQLGTVALNSSGVATYMTSSLTAGQDSITVYYGGDTNYLAATSQAFILPVYGALTPTVTVTPSSSSITSAQALTVTVAVSGGSGNPTPTGSVTLSGGGYTSPATTLSSGSASISIPAGSLATGSDTLTVSYTPDSSSSSTYNTATGTSSAVTVTQAKTTPTITWATPAAIIYGTALSATQFNATSPVAGTFAYTPAAGAVLPAGTQTLSVTFTPTDSADYTTATQTVSLTVNKAPLSVTANNQSMTYGGTVPTLTGTLSGVMAGDGITAAYTTTGTSASAAGSYPIKATLNDPNTKLSNYTVTNTSGLLTIGAATPTITWATPAAITYGTALSAAQLDATASVPGNFVYTPAAGTVPAAGNDTLSVTFTPANTADYTTATATVTLTVNIPNNPVPVIGGLSPAFTSAGGAAFTLTVNGTGFINGSTVYWGTTALTTTYASATQLTAAVTAAEITSAGVTQITVQTPAPGGGTSNALQFEVDSTGSGSTAPTLTAVTATVTAGSPASYTVSLPSTVESATVSCLNLPTGAACSYASGTVTITTSTSTPKGTYQITVIFTETVSGAASSWILLPILLLPLVILRKRLLARGAWVTACLGLVLLAGAAFCVTGCGGGGGSNTTPPPPQTHQVVSSGSVSLTIQ